MPPARGFAAFAISEPETLEDVARNGGWSRNNSPAPATNLVDSETGGEYGEWGEDDDATFLPTFPGGDTH
jgi:hypothetical protein